MKHTNEYRIGSETGSMNSISSTAPDDTFQWGAPPDDSLHYGDESHGLMDSCLQELENRGAMNFGEDNMNYMPEDQYGGGGGPVRGGGPYSSGDYNSYNGGPHLDTSLHSSHVSLQSSGSNRNNPRSQLKLSNQNLGSRTALPQEPAHNDNYAPYSSLGRNYDDYRNSPVPSNGSPHGPGTPTRFNNYYDDDHYRDSPTIAYDANTPGGYADPEPAGYGDQDSYDANPMQQFQAQETSSYHNDSFRGPPTNDRYGEQPEDSFYRQSPMMDNRYGGPVDDQRGVDPRDNYMDSPRDRPPYSSHDRYGDDSFQGQPDSYQGQPDSYNQGQPESFQPDSYNQGQPDSYQPDSYGQPDSYNQGQPNYSGSQSMIDRYGQPMNTSYPDGAPETQMRHPGDQYGDQLDDSYRGPQDDSFRGPVPQDDRYGDRVDDYRGDPPIDRYDDQPSNQSFQGAPPNSYPDNGPRGYDDDSFQESGGRRHEGLPAVQDDPFADDPFRQKQRSQLQLQQEDPYPRGPSPSAGSDRMGPGGYPDGPPPQYSDSSQPPYDQEPPGQYFDNRLGPGSVNGGPPMDGYPEDGQRTPSTVNDGTMRWRSPDLQEVIEYLSSPNDAIKANSAAYLTHLSYMDDGIKQKIRGMDGIPLLVDLLNSEYHEVHKNACGALKNLSYGRNNDNNKRDIKNAGGIPTLIRLLRKTQDEDVKESVTGVLWNLSSCDDLKMPIIDGGLAVLVNVVIIPESGWERRHISNHTNPLSLTTVFRNAIGVLRNVSSAGEVARKKLRECHGLVDSVIFTLRSAIEQTNVDNSPIQNCVCMLRNLAFRIQEIEDPDFYKKRNATLQRQKKQEKGEKTVGCFGGGNKKKSGQKGKNGQTIDDSTLPKLPPTANEYKALWGFDTCTYFLKLLTGSNPTMLEAACGAIQNLAACDWKPAVEIRALVRKEKGLPSLVDLLTFEEERVVGAAARSLRNLSIDERNKELVGKYAMKQLISNLPQENRPKELSDDTVSAVLACLNEVIQHNQDFAKSFCTDGGLPRLMYLLRSGDVYNARTKKFAAAVAKTLWKFKVLHSDFQQHGYSEKDFNPPATASQPNSNFSTPYGTINRPMQGQGYDETTLSSRRGNGYSTNHNTMGSNPRLVQGHSNPALDQRDTYGGSHQAIPMNDLSGYAPIDQEQHNHRKKPPAGAVALFPNMQQGGHPQGNPAISEPLYAKVDKSRKHGDDMGPPSPNSQVMVGQDNGQDGVDSWV